MGKVKLITKQVPAEAEADILAEDDAAFFEGILGSEGVFKIGSEFKADIISNNQIRIFDGVGTIGGRIFRIPYGENVDVNITNGTGGQKRNDIIVARWTKAENALTSDMLKLEVIKGTEKDPVLKKENAYQGGKIIDMPLYRIRLNGLNIEGIDQLFEVLHPPFTEKKYDESSFNIKEMYNVEDFVCVKKGNLVLFQVSLNGNGQINPNYPYSINKIPIPKELRPNYKAYLHAFSCNGQWGNAREMSVYVSPDGFINYSTPVKQAFFKIAGFWFVD